MEIPTLITQYTQKGLTVLEVLESICESFERFGIQGFHECAQMLELKRNPDNQSLLGEIERNLRDYLMTSTQQSQHLLLALIRKHLERDFKEIYCECGFKDCWCRGECVKGCICQCARKMCTGGYCACVKGCPCSEHLNNCFTYFAYDECECWQPPFYDDNPVCDDNCECQCKGSSCGKVCDDSD